MEENDQKPVETTPQSQASQRTEGQVATPATAIPQRIVDESMIMSVKNSSHEQENKSTKGQDTEEG